MNQKLDKSIKRFRQRTNMETLVALLGDGSGEVHDRSHPGRYFVRFKQANGYGAPVSLHAAPNANLRATDGLPVDIGYNSNGKQVILGVNLQANVESGANPLQFNPVDALTNDFVTQNKITTFYATRHADVDNKPFYAVVFAGMWYDNDQLNYFPGGSIDLSGLQPADGEHCYAVVFVKSDNTLEAFASTPIADADPLTIDDVQEAIDAMSAGSIPIWAFEIRGDDTEISVDPVRQLDIRQFVGTGSGGSGGGTVTNADNVGTGAGFFRDLIAGILNFRSLLSLHSAIVVNEDTDEVTVDLDESAIDHNSLANLTTSNPHTQYVQKSLWDANTLVKADSDDTPVALPVAASRIVARLAAGGIVAATVAEIKTLLAYVFTDIPGILGLAKGGTNADLSATGPGFLKQATTGAAVSVAALAAADLPSHDHSASGQGGATLSPETLTVSQDMYLGGEISPSALTGTQQDDYNPTGLADATVLRLNATSQTAISGIQGVAAKRVLILQSIGTALIVLLHDQTSTSTNRFVLPNNQNVFLRPNGSVILRYDNTTQRWRMIGQYNSALIQLSLSDDTWNKPAGAKTVEVILIGGGAGGGSGRKGSSGAHRRGGTGGGGGQRARKLFLADELSSSVTIDIGAGGVGGAAQTVSGNGNDGNDGLPTRFGTTTVYLQAGGGKKGLGGDNAGSLIVGGQGGTAANGTNQTAGDGQYGGGEIGGNGGDGTSPGGAAEAGGGGGGGTVAAATNKNGGDSVYGAGGGGAGGGSTGANNTQAAAGAGGGIQTYATGNGGAAGSIPSGAGAAGDSSSYGAGEGGGGGGCGVNSTSNTTGGAGGDGGDFGGGGGGGGCSTGTGDSGKGGDGADGLAIVVTYF